MGHRAAVLSAPDRARQANPITYITGDDPPFLVQNGERDTTVPLKNSRLMADALRAAGMDVQYDLLPGVGHGDGWFTRVFESDANIERIMKFLEEKLK